VLPIRWGWKFERYPTQPVIPVGATRAVILEAIPVAAVGEVIPTPGAEVEDPTEDNEVPDRTTVVRFYKPLWATVRVTGVLDNTAVATAKPGSLSNEHSDNVAGEEKNQLKARSAATLEPGLN
jgi:hypothetical protein